MNHASVEALSWQWLPSDDLLLAQFMIDYEVSIGDYLVAYDHQQHIVAAGKLSHLSDEHARLDVVVLPSFRRMGLGREVVNRLNDQATQQQFQRLIAFSEPNFWLSLGFLPTVDKTFSLLLPPATQALELTWHSGIPMTDYMKLAITAATPDRLVTSSELAASINVHQTMFAGAIYSQAVLTGWGLVHLALQRVGISGSIVLAKGEIRYRRPLSQQPTGVANQLIEITQLLPILSGDKVSIELTVEMFCQQQSSAAAIFNGRYVILPSPAA
ncbi:MAG: YiiD C-terminal domain-containing protein [Gammaproteobacteria bacterium]|nr:YiiD C-terminal domain-containing protein [Gammaproteobacteria bacterium]